MRKITTIIAIALFILNVTGCSSNKTNGMPKNITLGGSYSSLEKNYKNEDNDSERFFDISDQKLGDLKVDYECVKDDKKDIIKEIRVSELGSNSKKILNEFTRLYGKPIHKENYNDKRYDATDIWKLDDGKYVFLNLDDDSYATERKVLKNIMQDTYPRTCIVTTHRPTVLNICTRVYAIRDKRCEVLNEVEIEKMVKEF